MHIQDNVILCFALLLQIRHQPHMVSWSYVHEFPSVEFRPSLGDNQRLRASVGLNYLVFIGISRCPLFSISVQHCPLLRYPSASMDIIRSPSLSVLVRASLLKVLFLQRPYSLVVHRCPSASVRQFKLSVHFSSQIGHDCQGVGCLMSSERSRYSSPIPFLLFLSFFFFLVICSHFFYSISHRKSNKTTGACRLLWLPFSLASHISVMHQSSFDQRSYDLERCWKMAATFPVEPTVGLHSGTEQQQVGT